jgi:hypothetical protein
VAGVLPKQEATIATALLVMTNSKMTSILPYKKILIWRIIMTKKYGKDGTNDLFRKNHHYYFSYWVRLFSSPHTIMQNKNDPNRPYITTKRIK